VLDGIDFEIRKGEMLAIVGASGVGKSTFLHILGGLDRPTSGRVLYGEVDIFSLAPGELARFRNERVGFIFQFHHLLPEFSAIENVMIPALIRRTDPKIAVARALILKPDVVLADEPTGNLDTHTGEAIHDLLLSINKQLGITFVIVTHNDKLAIRADRVLRMEEGKLAQAPNF
jgi:lipoprotein-releasing system ATP-binding protein